MVYECRLCGALAITKIGKLPVCLECIDALDNMPEPKDEE